MEFIDLKTQQSRIRNDVEKRISSVLDHGRYLMGPEVVELEERLAGYAGVRHAVTVSSGTDALVIALMALGIGRGDEVITPAFTFVATAEAVALIGATPVFADIKAETYNLDPVKVEAALTSRTRAIIAVDLFGQCADLPELEALADRHGLALIEDAAQSFGATLGVRRAGSFGTIACTSFFPAKPLGCYGDGGACFIDDDGLAQAMREIRHHGQNEPYRHVRVGMTGRLDTLQAAVLLAKLSIFDDEIRLRQEVARRYDELLPSTVGKPRVETDRTSVWAQFTIHVDGRDQVRAELAERGIPSNIYYPEPLYRQPPYYQDIHLPRTENAAAGVLSLPMHPYLHAEDQQEIAAALAAITGG